jgi:hypothetical protein
LSLTHEELRKILHYDPSTGHFTWLEKIGNRSSVGGTAGGANVQGYIFIGLRGRSYPAHRLAWFYCNGVWPPHQIDHINLVRHDNRLDNLRLATRAQNGANRRAMRCGLKGAYPSQNGKWKAKIQFSGKLKHLGTFDSEHEAHMAYAMAAMLQFGEYARTA